MRSRNTLIGFVVVMIATAIAVPSIWWATQPPSAVGSLDRFSERAEDRAARPASRPASLGSVTVRSGRVEDAEIGAAAPVRLRIDGVGIDAPVRSVGLLPNGEMEIPSAVSDIGWYRLGATPGRPGSAVLAGHVDSRDQGPGAFFRLKDVEPGARITVTDNRGVARTFEVVARRQFPKDQLPADAFATSGDPRLVLITCGGDFDAGARSYRDNIAVYAVAI